ncbi:MAG TPA: tetratricopeptide repeat protein [Xanthomonadaceae bacterium]|nr:tetratricopeptide repeat protein [Xanthomonadaceae bacterium]
MSPEQAEGSADIDTRTDIYSLGVILYQLLTDTTPLGSDSLHAAAYGEVQRIIREVEPPRPSVRLSQSARKQLVGPDTRRPMDPGKLARIVRGELDWIVMKAIEKDRTRRYETANALAMDVRRYLAGEAVLAAPPSASYRLRKFIRRNKGAVAAGSLIAASLVAGVAGFAWQARIAQQRADELEKVSTFQAEMLGQVDLSQSGRMLSDDVQAKFQAALIKEGVADPARAAQEAAFAGQWRRVDASEAASDLIDRTILKPAAIAIDKQFKDQPVVDASLRQVLADRYADMGLYDAALPLQVSALATRRRVLGNDSPDTLKSIDGMGSIFQGQGKLRESERLFREALAGQRRVLGEDNPATLESVNGLGLALYGEGKIAEAEPLLRDALERRRRVLGEENKDTLISANNLGLLLQDQGKLAEAEPYFREALKTARRVLGEERAETIYMINNMGLLLYKQRKLVEAEVYYREALEKARRVWGDENPQTLEILNNLGGVQRDEGKLGDAEASIREALEKNRRVQGEEHLDTLMSLSLMGSVLVAQGRYAEAEKLLEPGEAAIRKTFTGDQKKRVARFLLDLGRARTGQGEFAAAESNLLEAQPIFVEKLGLKDQYTLDCTQALVDLYAAWNKAEPGKGYDAKLAEWKQKLDALGAAAPAAAAH